jgi:methionine transaminase
MNLDSKLPRVGTTIFTVMSQLAEKHGAINLSQGFPDYQPPGALVERVTAALRAGKNQYAPMIGVEALRVAIAKMMANRYTLTVDPATEVTVTSGATEALFAAIHAVVRSGDEVIVFDPSYDSYEPAITLAGGRALHVPLEPPGFEIDWGRVERMLGARTRLVILNSPHNPSGALIDAENHARLAQLLRGLHCFVLSDEVYEHIVFDDARHRCVLMHPELRERSFAVFSFGKTYHATGWKVGYCVAPPSLTREFRAIHQFLMFATTTPLQFAIAEYLEACPEHHETLGAFYQTKRDHFAELLRPSRLELLPCRGTYFQLADYSAVSQLADTEFAQWLTAEHRVAPIPISVFYREARPGQRIVRFCFAKESATLVSAAQRLAEL